MFVQIHMLQSMPPGNPNRDDTGQPKKCIFGRVTRARISSQCLKRNIRAYFKNQFGDALAVRTKYLPLMIADALKKMISGISDDELGLIKAKLATKFKAEVRKGTEAEEGTEENEDAPKEPAPAATSDQTGQLVFFPPPFALESAKLIASFRNENGGAYQEWIGASVGQNKKLSKQDKNKLKKDIESFEQKVLELSRSLTVDIGMFGRMTTSDLVVNVEASCQVAHAISTHEAIIENDYFTAMDDLETGPGAAFIGSGEQKTFFDSAVYYKYLNLDIDELKKSSLVGQR